MMRRGLFILGAALLVGVAVLPTWAQNAPTFDLTILHTNDTHSHHDPDASGDGGDARESTVIQQIRAEQPNVILLDAGDRFTGTLYHQQYHGQDNVQIMNALSYNAMTLGNHEFDDGEDVLARFIDGLKFPVVSANIDFSQSAVLAGKVTPYTVLTVGGEKLGLIGLTTPQTPTSSSPGKELVFSSDLAAITQKYVDELTAQGINKIILVTHDGLSSDTGLATKVSGVDVIVGGHSHTLLSNSLTGAAGAYPVAVQSSSGEPVVIVQAGEYTVHLGRLDATFDEKGVLTTWNGDTILLSRYITPDPAIEKILSAMAGPIEALKQQKIGTQAVFLVGDRAVCRFAECNWGDVITDAVRLDSKVDLVILNGGGIRTNIPNVPTPADLTLDAPRDLTMGDVLTVLPFGNIVSTFKLTGADVLAALENGVSAVDQEEGTGRFAQVSGLRFSFDARRPVGSRVSAVEVLGADGSYAPLDPDRIYSVAANDFMRAGGDHYEVFQDRAVDAYDFGRPLEQVVADYIASHSPITALPDGRITRIDRP